MISLSLARSTSIFICLILALIFSLLVLSSLFFCTWNRISSDICWLIMRSLCASTSSSLAIVCRHSVLYSLILDSISLCILSRTKTNFRSIWRIISACRFLSSFRSILAVSSSFANDSRLSLNCESWSSSFFIFALALRISLAFCCSSFRAAATALATSDAFPRFNSRTLSRASLRRVLSRSTSLILRSLSPTRRFSSLLFFSSISAMCSAISRFFLKALVDLAFISLSCLSCTFASTSSGDGSSEAPPSLPPPRALASFSPFFVFFAI
mmetsp:Transcript_2714/g.5374  ORF Transcript_2714/g.5374 Transcript_2714/m.5374 type:complete len:269 (+) Transcript_2714:746-1552(+)